jgi:hypothetical protein
LQFLLPSAHPSPALVLSRRLQHRSFFQLLIRLSGIVGGVFATSGTSAQVALCRHSAAV